MIFIEGTILFTLMSNFINLRYKFHSKKGLRGYSHPKVIVNRKILYIAFMLAFMMSAHKNQEIF